jgi:hypothetical protein
VEAFLSLLSHPSTLPLGEASFALLSLSSTLPLGEASLSLISSPLHSPSGRSFLRSTFSSLHSPFGRSFPLSALSPLYSPSGRSFLLCFLVPPLSLWEKLSSLYFLTPPLSLREKLPSLCPTPRLAYNKHQSACPILFMMYLTIHSVRQFTLCSECPYVNRRQVIAPNRMAYRWPSRLVFDRYSLWISSGTPAVLRYFHSPSLQRMQLRPASFRIVHCHPIVACCLKAGIVESDRKLIS